LNLRAFAIRGTSLASIVPLAWQAAGYEKPRLAGKSLSLDLHQVQQTVQVSQDTESSCRGNDVIPHRVLKFVSAAARVGSCLDMSTRRRRLDRPESGHPAESPAYQS
jgi:hypothetical protein